MIITSLVAATVAAAEPQVAPQAPAPQPAAAPAPAAEKKMACCEKMTDGEGCCCCKDKAGKSDHEGHGDHQQ